MHSLWTHCLRYLSMYDNNDLVHCYTRISLYSRERKKNEDYLLSTFVISTVKPRIVRSFIISMIS